MQSMASSAFPLHLGCIPWRAPIGSRPLRDLVSWTWPLRTPARPLRVDAQVQGALVADGLVPLPFGFNSIFQYAGHRAVHDASGVATRTNMRLTELFQQSTNRSPDSDDRRRNNLGLPAWHSFRRIRRRCRRL